MDTKHTPGPWEIDGGALAIGGEIIAGCSVLGPETASIMERRANARLIAAAPDLLAACQRLADETQFDNWDGHTIVAIRKIAEDARAAIAKATGEAKP